jgi:pimeloyl-ACP methyl ester carboxylesterase
MRNQMPPPRVYLLVLLAVVLPLSAFSSSCPATRGRGEAFQASDDVTINYSVLGEGSRTLIALHGFGSSLDTWNDIAPNLKSHYRLVTLDLVGFGLSAHPKEFHYTVQQQAGAVASFVEFITARFGGNPVTLIGHSYGGSVAMVSLGFLKDRNKSLVDRLILIDALGFPQHVHFPLYINILRVPIVNRLVLSLTPATFRARWVLNGVLFRHSLVTSERVCRYAQFFDTPGSHTAFIRTARQLGNKAEVARLSKEIARIDVPTLIIWGAHDRLIPPRQADLLGQAIPNSQKPSFLESGHVPHEEQPAQTASLIEKFLGHY